MRLLTLLLLFASTQALPAITFVNGSGGSTAGSNSGTSAVVPAITGIQDDDLILCHASLGEASTGDWTDPSGFVELDDVAETGGGDSRLYYGYKIASSESGDYTFTSGTSGRVQATCTAWRGVDTSSPFDVTYVQASHYIYNSQDENGQARPITTSSPNAVVVLIEFISHNDLTAIGPPSGYTERHSYTGTTAAQFFRQHYWASKEVVSPGLEVPGPYTHTENGTDVNDTSSVTLALRPAVEGSGAATWIRRRR